MEVEKTLALIKPDAVAAGKAEEIMHLIEVKGFTIVAKQKMQVSDRAALTSPAWLCPISCLLSLRRPNHRACALPNDEEHLFCIFELMALLL